MLSLSEVTQALLNAMFQLPIGANVSLNSENPNMQCKNGGNRHPPPFVTFPPPASSSILRPSSSPFPFFPHLTIISTLCLILIRPHPSILIILPSSVLFLPHSSLSSRSFPSSSPALSSLPSSSLPHPFPALSFSLFLLLLVGIEF